MGSRQQLQELLETFCDHVYFQPPTNVTMEYPCIIYHRDYADTKFAGDIPYRYVKRYMVTVVDRDPDSAIPDKIATLSMCVFNRFYTADGLNHDVFNLFF